MASKQRAVTEENFGAWVLVASPRVWDLRRFINEGHRRLPGWSVANNYRSQMMAAGHRAFLWALPGYEGMEPGIVGTGIVTSPPTSDRGDDYWLDLKKKSVTDHFVALEITLLQPSIPQSAFKDNPTLATAEVIRLGRLSNPSFLTKDQLAALDKLLTATKGRP